MGKYNLEEILNIGDEIENINGKTFRIRQLTIKERVVLDKILKNASNKLLESVAPSLITKLLQFIGIKKAIDVFKEGKDNNDFLFIKTCLDFCNPKQLFTFKDFEALTTNQTIGLQKIISDQNYFFDMEKLLKEVEIQKK